MIIGNGRGEIPAKNGLVCGIDEAGRGPLAGPVYAAAVILGDGFPVSCLKDSKKLSELQRKKAETLILDKALAYGIGWATHEEIDGINILQASLLAMKRAFEALAARCAALPAAACDVVSVGTANIAGGGIEAIVDGLFAPDIAVPCRALVKADSLVPEVMAASILAKEARDRYMLEMDALYPQYGYSKHKGYPTKLHCERIAEYGPSPIQRLTFKIKALHTKGM